MKKLILISLLLSPIICEASDTGVPSRMYKDKITQRQRDAMMIDMYYNSMRRGEEYNLEQLRKKKAQESNDLYQTSVLWTQPNTVCPNDVIWKFRFQQASNGLPSFQYDVGTNYLAKGDTNMAKYWLGLSCKQGNIEASNILHKIN